jgi:hypothetical protein
MVALWLSLVAAGEEPATARTGGVVIADRLPVLDQPDPTAFTSGELAAGTRVVIVATLAGGWLSVEPPPGAFDWVDARSLQSVDAGRAEVIAESAPLRSASPTARLPGPPRPPLPRGTIVRLVDRTPLHPDRLEQWQAIEPPSGEVRYVRVEGVRRDPPQVISAKRVQSELDPDVEPAAFRPGIPPAPAGIAADLAPIDALHRSILAEPMDRWDLEPARRRYTALLARVSESTATAAIQARLDRLDREAEIAQAARKFTNLLNRSARIDREVNQARTTLEEARIATDRGFDARGLLQASSRKVEGEKVYALIGSEGRTTAYLSLPPGIPAQSLLARKVGVRGTVRYNAELGARLITVRDLEELEKSR